MSSVDWMMVFAVAFLCVFDSAWCALLGVVYFGAVYVEKKWVNDDWSKT